MKFSPLLAPAVFSVAFVSCDQAEKITSKVKSSVTETIASVKSDVSIKPDIPDSRLQALVDQTSEGYIFRKDLPFPANLTVRTTQKLTYSNARQVQNNVMERKASRLEGSFSEEIICSRRGDDFIVQIGTKNRITTDPNDPEKTIAAAVADSKSGKSIRLTQDGKSWSAAKNSDFNSHVLTQEILPHATAFFTEAGALPRALWFGKKRIKPGDTITISQAELPMLHAFSGKGNLNLILQSVESVHGHPCGVFSVSGNYSANPYFDLTGEKTSLDMTLSSGKIWLSLLHPIVLKQELETIQTQTSTHSNIEGGIHLSIDREWKAE
ncbi:MAG: hypothetical protein QM680_08635 [Luteolibacter sp.]